MIRQTTRLEVDEEELAAIIVFRRAQRHDALDRGHAVEAQGHQHRIAELEIALRRKVDWR